jgi:isopentenyldiphosphate isomerase
MSFFDHIAACNAHDLGHFVPFAANGMPVGWVRPALADAIAAASRDFALDGAGLALDPGLADFDSRSNVVAEVMEHLSETGVIPRLRDEMYAVAPSFMEPALFQLDRGAVPSLGVRAYGVHVNGFVRNADGSLDLWIGRRASTQTLCPDMLDNMVAGGMPIGIAPIDNVIKEAHEEAGVPRELARKAKPTGAVRYMMETPEGLRQDTMFCYDLELPADFVPVNTDGEVAEFLRLPAEEVKAIVRDTFDFKFNCNLVAMDFLIRHGVLTDSDGDVAALRKGIGQTL